MTRRFRGRGTFLGVAAAACLGCAAGHQTPVAAPAMQAPRGVEVGADAVRTAPGRAQGTAPAKAEEFKGDVLVVQVAASGDLNKFNNQPHTVVLVLYQLSEPSVFSQLLETPEGKAKLLEAEAFDPTVLSRRRVIVQPGEAQSVALDRMAGARYLAAVGGFYSAETQNSGRLIPVIVEKGGVLFWSKPKPQLISLELGKSGFTR